MKYSKIEIDNLKFIIRKAIDEDLLHGDITSNLSLDENQQAEFIIKSRSAIKLCGIDVLNMVFMELGYECKFKNHYSDGDLIKANEILISGSANAIELMSAERIILNLMQLMSSIATLTNEYVQAIKHFPTILLDTRKTTPGLRYIAKYATRVGGARNHRMNLSDSIMLKDNHIALSNKSMSEIISHIKLNASNAIKVEVECDNLDQFHEALQTDVDVIMLDNMSISDMREAVKIRNLKNLPIKIEASGNVNLQSIVNIAETGVDFISVGKITHSAPSVDIGLDIS